MIHRAFSRKAIAFVAASSLVAACSGGRGGGQIPAAPGSGGSFVAAYGANQAQMSQMIADAAQAGKTARFVTIETTKNSYLFSPKDPIVRTNVSLIIGAFGHLYVWPITAVKQIIYSASATPVNLQAIPLAKAAPIDQTLEKIITSVASASKKGNLDSSRLNNSSPICPDCYMIMLRRKPKSSSDPAVLTEDSWQHDPDYTDWIDSALAAQPAPTDPPLPGGIHPQDCSWYADGSPWGCNNQGWGGCNFYWYCAWYDYPSWYFYDPQWSGGGYTPTNDPAGCALDQGYCDFTDDDWTNDLAYSDGGGGNYTHAPWSCFYTPDLRSGSVYTSSTDGLPCSIWQIFHYLNQYCDFNNNCTVAPVFNHPWATSISLNIASIGGSSYGIAFDFPLVGHLYVQDWVGAVTPPGAAVPLDSPLQAGPENPTSPYGRLVTQTYAQDALGSPHVFLPINVSSNSMAAQNKWQTLVGHKNTYVSNEGQAPGYNYLAPNSNSWVDALLEKSGFQESDISNALLKLTAWSGQVAPGVGSGSTLLYLF